MKQIEKSLGLRSAFKSLAKVVVLLLGVLLATERAGAQACDSLWSWQSISQPASYGVGHYPIADAKGTLVAVGAGSDGSQAVLGYNVNLQTWTVYAHGFIGVLGGSGSGVINAMVTANGRKVYIGGSFTGFTDSNNNSVNATNVAVLDLPTKVWTAMNENETNCAVYSLAVDSHTNIYAGLQSNANSDPYLTNNVDMLVIFDQSTQTWNPVGNGGGFHLDAETDSCGPSPAFVPPIGITALATNGNDLYVAGSFDQCGYSNGGSVTAYHLAKWTQSSQTWTAIATGRHWCSFNPNGDPYVASIVVNSNTLYVTGNISPACNATYPQGLAAFPTSGGGLQSDANDNLWGPEEQYQGSTYYLAGSGKSLCTLGCAVYLAGSFQGAGGSSGPGTSPAYGIAESISGGAFTSWTGSGTYYGVSLTGAPGTGYCVASDTIYDATQGQPMHIFLVGDFDTMPNGNPAPGIAVWQYIPQ